MSPIGQIVSAPPARYTSRWSFPATDAGYDGQPGESRDVLTTLNKSDSNVPAWFGIDQDGGTGVTDDYQTIGGRFCHRIQAAGTGIPRVGFQLLPWTPGYEGATIQSGAPLGPMTVAIFDLWFRFQLAASSYPTAGQSGIFFRFADPGMLPGSNAVLPGRGAAGTNRCPFGIEAVDDGAGGQGYHYRAWDIDGVAVETVAPSSFAPQLWNHARAEVLAASPGQDATLSFWMNGEQLVDGRAFGTAQLLNPQDFGFEGRTSLRPSVSVEANTNAALYWAAEGRLGPFRADGSEVT